MSQTVSDLLGSQLLRIRLTDLKVFPYTIYLLAEPKLRMIMP